MRMVEEEAVVLRQLVAQAGESDTLFVNTGLNSLLLWSNEMPAGGVVFNHSTRFLSPEQQRDIRLAIQSSERPLVVMVDNRWSEGGGSYTELENWLNRTFTETGRLGRYVLMQSTH